MNKEINVKRILVTFKGCSFQTTLSNSKTTYGGLRKNKEINVKRILVIPSWAISVSRYGGHHTTALRATGASAAYRKSQAMVDSSEAPQFVGSGDGTDNLDYLADLQTLEVIDPERNMTRPPDTSDELEANVPMFDGLGEQWESFGFCAWCDQKFSSHHFIEQHHKTIHAVVLQFSGSSPPSVFQRVRIRQRREHRSGATHRP